MSFQSSDFKKKNFLELLDNNLKPIKLSAISVKIKESGLDLFYFIFFLLFFFLFNLFFYFLFLEQLGLGLICHTVTSVTTGWHSHKTDHKTGKNIVEDSRTNDII